MVLKLQVLETASQPTRNCVYAENTLLIQLTNYSVADNEGGGGKKSQGFCECYL